MLTLDLDVVLWLLIAALILDAVVGDPDWLWRHVPHPVVGFGRLIGLADKAYNSASAPPTRRRVAGALLVLFLLCVAVLIGLGIQVTALSLLPTGWGYGLVIVVAAIFIAQNSLDAHVRRVATAFDTGGLPQARHAVSMIVGRDPAHLDRSGVCRAAIESTAENFSDGVVAPCVWFLVGGLPGLLAYKAINTADSMIGHRSDTYRDFGWASARLDDGLNILPARLSGVAIALMAPAVGGRVRRALSAMWRDASKHRSPNAGWPEAAMAGGLDLALAGPRVYAEGAVVDAYMNDGATPDATPGDIRRALFLMWAAWGLLLLATLVGALLTSELLILFH